MFIELAAAVLALGGGYAALRSAKKMGARKTLVAKAPRKSFVELHDVVLAGRAQHCLVGELVILDGAKPVRLLVDTFGETPVWVHVPPSTMNELDVLREVPSPPSGVIPSEFTADHTRYIATRSGRAQVAITGDVPNVSGPVQFSVYEAIGGRVALVIDSPSSRLTLAGERMRPGMYELLPGK